MLLLSTSLLNAFFAGAGKPATTAQDFGALFNMLEIAFCRLISSLSHASEQSEPAALGVEASVFPEVSRLQHLHFADSCDCLIWLARPYA